MAKLEYTHGELIYTSPDSRVQIYKGQLCSDGSPIAIKEQVFTSLKVANSAIRESMNQARLVHPSIVRIYDCEIDEGESRTVKAKIVVELMETDLGKRVRKRTTERRYWREEELMDMLGKLTSALSYAQSIDIAHRDIKPQNIFSSEDETLIKIGDFGSASCNTTLRSPDSEIHGSPLYLSPLLKQAHTLSLTSAPRIISHNTYKSDVYSLGLTFLHFAFLDPPIQMMKLGALAETTKSYMDGLGQYPSVQRVLSWMLAIEERDRPDFGELDRYLKSIGYPRQNAEPQAGGDDARRQTNVAVSMPVGLPAVGGSDLDQCQAPRTSSQARSPVYTQPPLPNPIPSTASTPHIKPQIPIPFQAPAQYTQPPTSKPIPSTASTPHIKPQIPIPFQAPAQYTQPPTSKPIPAISSVPQIKPQIPNHFQAPAQANKLAFAGDPKNLALPVTGGWKLNGFMTVPSPANVQESPQAYQPQSQSPSQPPAQWPPETKPGYNYGANAGISAYNRPSSSQGYQGGATGYQIPPNFYQTAAPPPAPKSMSPFSAAKPVNYPQPSPAANPPVWKGGVPAWPNPIGNGQNPSQLPPGQSLPSVIHAYPARSPEELKAPVVCLGCETVLQPGGVLATLSCGHSFHSRECFFVYLEGVSQSFLKPFAIVCPQCHRASDINYIIAKVFGKNDFDERKKNAQSLVCSACGGKQELYELTCGHRVCARHTDGSYPYCWICKQYIGFKQW